MNRRAFGVGAAAVLLTGKGHSFSHGSSVQTLAQLQSAYVAYGHGLALHFNMATFTDVEQASSATSVNTFNPTALNIDQWVTTAQSFKAKYALLTVKHSDGFCLWPTATTTHNVSSSSWYAANGHIDIVFQFVTKFRAAGIAPVIYFSVPDGTLDTLSPTQGARKTYLQAQLAELLSSYGAVAAVWIDRATDQTPFPWSTNSELKSFVHGLQASCLCVVNDHNFDSTTSDVMEYEGGTRGDVVPSNNSAPAELIETLRSDNNWFWKSSGNALKSNASILAEISASNSHAASFLLNTGPDTSGTIPANMVTALAALGLSL